ncbi:hypothetical protein D3C81_2270910 [compost metagenome]
MPLGRVAGVSTTVAGVIVKVYTRLPVWPLESVERTVMLKLPSDRGMPVSAPAEVKDMPIGSAPLSSA